ncbi:plasma membrane fusion protein prm1 [Dimargaris cristalligena]|nr:plasma membrane fusion protein prm1 [Dimargaris cristalligena]
MATESTPPYQRRIGRQFQPVSLSSRESNFIDLSDPNRVMSINLGNGSPNFMYLDHPPEKSQAGPTGTIFSPYLGLNAKLSRAWATYLIIIILFYAVRLYLHSVEVDRFGQDTKDDFLRSCQSVERVGNTLLSLPQKAAEETNEIVNKAALAVVNRTADGLVLAVTLLEEIIVFLISAFRAFQLCVADLVIQGGLSLFKAGMADLQSSFNTAMNSTIKGIQSQVTDVVGWANKIVDGSNSLFDLVSGNSRTIPSISYPDTSSWTVQIPDQMNTDLDEATKKVPILADVEAQLIDLLRKPFENLKSTIRSGFSRIKVNTSLVGVPEAAQANFCDPQTSAALVDGLAQATRMIFLIGVGVLVGIAVALILLNMARIRREHQQLMTFIRSRHPLHPPPPGGPGQSVHEIQMQDIHTGIAQPWLYSLNERVHKRYSNVEKAHLVRWWMQYVYHIPSLACLASGILGLLVIANQIRSINQLREKYTPEAAHSLNTFRSHVVGNMTQDLTRVSNDFAGGINRQLAAMEFTVNEDIFGPIKKGTGALNSSLDIIINDTRTVVGDIFNNTPFESAAMDFVNCAFIKKIQAIGKLFTYINDAANVTLPRVDPNALVVGVEPLNRTMEDFVDALVGQYVGTMQDVHGLLANSTYLSEKDTNRLGALAVEAYLNKTPASAVASVWEARQPATVYVPEGLYRRDGALPDDQYFHNAISINLGEEAVQPTGPDNSLSMPTPTNSAQRVPSSTTLHEFPNTPTPVSLLRRDDDTTTTITQIDAISQVMEGIMEAATSTTEVKGLLYRITHRPTSPTGIEAWFARPTTAATAKATTTTTTPSEPPRNTQAGQLMAILGNTLQHYRPYTDADLRRADVSGGYTGGLIGKLIDKYIRMLQGEIPLLLVMIGVWFVIVLMGTVRVLGARLVWRKMWNSTA